MTDDVNTLRDLFNIVAVSQITLAYLAVEIGREFGRIPAGGDDTPVLVGREGGQYMAAQEAGRAGDQDGLFV